MPQTLTKLPGKVQTYAGHSSCARLTLIQRVPPSAVSPCKHPLRTTRSILQTSCHSHPVSPAMKPLVYKPSGKEAAARSNDSWGSKRTLAGDTPCAYANNPQRIQWQEAKTSSSSSVNRFQPSRKQADKVDEETRIRRPQQCSLRALRAL